MGLQTPRDTLPALLGSRRGPLWSWPWTDIAEGGNHLLTLPQGHIPTKCRSQTFIQLYSSDPPKGLRVARIDATDSVHQRPCAPSGLICVLTAASSSLAPWLFARGVKGSSLTALPSDNSKREQTL